MYASQEYGSCINLSCHMDLIYIKSDNSKMKAGTLFRPANLLCFYLFSLLLYY